MPDSARWRAADPWAIASPTGSPGLPASLDPELGELVQDVLPERVIERMEQIDQPERT